MCGWGAIGLFAGLGYKTSHLYITRVREATLLTPSTDVLAEHEELFSLCLRVQKFRDFGEYEYEQFIINTDRLLYFLKICREEDFEPEDGDKKLAFSHYKTSNQHLKNLYNEVHRGASPKQVATLKQLYSKINKLTQEVWLLILQNLSR